MASAIQIFERGKMLIDRAVEYARERPSFARGVLIERLECKRLGTDGIKKTLSRRLRYLLQPESIVDTHDTTPASTECSRGEPNDPHRHPPTAASRRLQRHARVLAGPQGRRQIGR